MVNRYLFEKEFLSFWKINHTGVGAAKLIFLPLTLMLIPTVLQPGLTRLGYSLKIMETKSL